MGELELYYNTIKYLRSGQVLHQCLGRLRKIVRRLLGRKYNFSLYKEGVPLQLSAPIDKYESCRGKEFTFLNIKKRFDGTWDYKELGPLWSFNINYMEYLLQPSMTFDDGCGWIMRFIGSQETNAIGMSPYCIALRSVNWIKFITRHRAEFSAGKLREVETSLYSQLRILHGNLEYNLAGNHLLEDFFALLWGGIYFDDKKMYYAASTGLMEQLEEQTLADGANFEQSPMYHCIILDRVLDAVNLLQNNSRFDGQESLCSFMRDKAAAMLGWLKAISYSDGTFPLFNDSAEGIAPTPAELYDYASRLGVEWSVGISDASGYHCVDNDKYELRMDVGGIAASYIPGHSHADTFNFELRIGGTPFIVDSGISTYQWCERRQYERSTAAHNTVTVNDDNSSRVWAAFRCAQRAGVFDIKKSESGISATHDGFSKYGVLHTRTFSWSADSIEVTDTLTGGASGKAYLHFAPGVDLCLDGTKAVAKQAVMTFENASSLELLDGECATQYNCLRKCNVLCVSFEGTFKCEIRIL